MTLDQMLPGECAVLVEALAQPRVRRQAFLHSVILAGIAPRAQPEPQVEVRAEVLYKANAHGRVVEIHLDRRATVDRTILQHLDSLPPWRRSAWLRDALVNGYALERLPANGATPAPVIGAMLRAPKAQVPQDLKTPETPAVRLDPKPTQAPARQSSRRVPAEASVAASPPTEAPAAAVAAVAEIPASSAATRVRSSTEQILLDPLPLAEADGPLAGDGEGEDLEHMAESIPHTVVSPAKKLKGLFE